MTILLPALFVAMLLPCTDVLAVSLAGRPTDDGVCDLSPMTTYRLTRKVFVPAGTSGLPDIYARLALQYVTVECKNGQVLLLHSDLGNSEDEDTFRKVVGELCSPAEIARESSATVEYPYAFQVKCKLSKIQEAKQRLAAADRIQTVDEMIQERAPVERRAETDGNAPKPKECSQKIGLGQILLGFGGNCR